MGRRHPASTPERILRGRIGTPCGLLGPTGLGHGSSTHVWPPLGPADQPQTRNWSSPKDRSQGRTWSGPQVASTGSGSGEAGLRHQEGIAATRSFGATCPAQRPMTRPTPRVSRCCPAEEVQPVAQGLVHRLAGRPASRGQGQFLTSRCIKQEQIECS